MPTGLAAILAIVVPALIVAGAGKFVLRMTGRAPQSPTTQARRRWSRAFGLLLIPCVLGLLALVSAAPYLASGAVRSNTIALLAFGSLLLFGGATAEVVVWRQLRRSYR